MVITIDGPSASGKSSLARLLSARLGGTYLDTGAMYRAVYVTARRQGIDMSDEKSVGGVASNIDITFARDTRERGEHTQRVIANGIDVTDAIREPDSDKGASVVSSYPAVRAALLDKQRKYANGSIVVAEGRDTGTVVFPDADVKIYLSADVASRARRRLLQRGAPIDDGSIESETLMLRERDYRDEHRSASPLSIPDGAVMIDNTGIPMEVEIETIVDVIESR